MERLKPGNFHVDMSGRFYTNRTVGIAIVGADKENYGCALKGNLIKLVKRRLFLHIYKDAAKLYAICTFLLIKNIKSELKSLIVCNDEDFKIVKRCLRILIKNPQFKIINITEFRKKLGRNVGSFADNYAKVYRKRALKNRRIKGKKINIVPVNFKTIKLYWEKLKKV